MRKILFLAFTLTSVIAFAQSALSWSETTYRTENISGSFVSRGAELPYYICNIKGQTYTFENGTAVMAERWLKKAAVVHIFKLNTTGQQPVRVFALDTKEEKRIVGANYVIALGNEMYYYNEKTNDIYRCKSSYARGGRELFRAKKEKGFLLDRANHLVIYD